MKTVKYILGMVLSSIAALSAQADTNWSVGVVVGNPYPPAYYAPPAAYYAPPPVVIYRHPHSTYYTAPAVTYPAPAPGLIQFGYGSVYRSYDRGPRGHRGGWSRGHGHHHHH